MSHLRIEGRDLHFSYRGRAILEGASLASRSGELVALLGPNGAGKSTLLRLLLGLLTPSSGQVRIDGVIATKLPQSEIARRIAYVPQTHLTPFPYTVREIVLLGRLPISGIFVPPSRHDETIVADVLQRLSISHLAERVYTEISGGERQLTLIARALAQGARALVMDEPMASLDFGYQVRLAEHLQALADDGYAIIMSTHDPRFAHVSATRVALLSGRRIVADGRPGEILTADAIRSLYNVDFRDDAPATGASTFFCVAKAGP
jgi:iron complex transport system ATP-binding protein